MKKQLTDRLQAMINRSFTYGRRTHTVRSFEVKDGRLTLVTDLETYSKPAEAVDEFLSHWEPAQPLAVTEEQEQGVVAFQQENNLVDKLTDILLDNIEKVRANPEYIKQAQAINNNVNSIINVTKLKLDVVKAARSRR